MRRIVALLMLAVATQAAAEEIPWRLLRPLQEDTSHRTLQGRQDIIARLKAKPDERPALARGSAPQPLEAGGTSKDIQSRVINGGAAARGQFPWYAYIVLGSSSFCGGTLISSTWILTAAQCTGYASYTVTLGITSLLESQEGIVSQVSRYWVMHANYGNAFRENDVAIIRLSTPISSTDLISPVRLPRYSQASQSFTGLDAIVTGFGRISSYNFTNSPTLQFAHVEIITNDECSRYFPLDQLESNICVLGEDGRSPCDGDYGGPAVILEDDDQYTVVGIMSLNTLHCPSGAPAAYSRITNFLRWIETYSGIAVRE